MNIAGWGSSDKEGNTATSVPEGSESKTGRGPSYQEIIGMFGTNKGIWKRGKNLLTQHI